MKYPKLATKKSQGASDGEPRRQYAALPWRILGEGVEVLLASSRDTRRWVIPKGWPMKGRKPYMTAAIEAQEAPAAPYSSGAERSGGLPTGCLAPMADMAGGCSRDTTTAALAAADA